MALSAAIERPAMFKDIVVNLSVRNGSKAAGDYAISVGDALNAAGVMGRLTHVSTAGGAFLESLEGKTLPGVAVLTVLETPEAGCR